ncbi:hypothetical protein Q31b_06250 [Novipirellula aureliae]|uniref:Secreted protein n=1 Tax=Novipirellula aureliae TaxID=2527966 RepID=A0A5C6E726_9BACT|nr:hypothetical protein [Novipirellula aureliae]TWU45453.1 hypothetical protein Q31b_06250 [Novipirellula aureliae]
MKKFTIMMFAVVAFSAFSALPGCGGSDEPTNVTEGSTRADLQEIMDRQKAETASDMNE